MTSKLPFITLSCFRSDRDRDPAELPSEDSKMDAEGIAAKRRPSRPLKLDSEGEEQVETSEKEESLSDREEDLDEAKATQRLSSDKVRSSDVDGFANVSDRFCSVSSML